MRARVVSAFLLAAVAATAAPLNAGTYTEHETIFPLPDPTKPGSFVTHKATVKTWQDGRKYKRNNPMRDETVIINLDKGEVVGINDKAKTYWRLPAERYRQIALFSLIVMGVQPRADGGLDVPDNLFLKTGATAKIEGRDAYEVRVQGKLPPQVQTSIWLSEQVPVGTDRMVEELRFALGDPQGPGYDKLFSQWKALKGYPVQNVTEVQTPSGKVTTSETLLKYLDQKVAASEFDVPKGYALTIDPLTQLEALSKQMGQGPMGQGLGQPAPAPTTTPKPATPAPKKP
jgi:hypothetical protein